MNVFRFRVAFRTLLRGAQKNTKPDVPFGTRTWQTSTLCAGAEASSLLASLVLHVAWHAEHHLFWWFFASEIRVSKPMSAAPISVSVVQERQNQAVVCFGLFVMVHTATVPDTAFSGAQIRNVWFRNCVNTGEIDRRDVIFCYTIFLTIFKSKRQILKKMPVQRNKIMLSTSFRQKIQFLLYTILDYIC